MATTITGSTVKPDLWTHKLEVTENSVSVADNTSSVTVDVYIGRTSSGGASYMEGADINVTIGVTGCTSQSFTYSNSNRVNIAAGGWHKIGSVTFANVPHNNDGTKTVTVTSSFTNDISPASGSASGTVNLTSIYTISYNANGGSGAPSNQKKVHGKTLTLSGTKPTRPGHTFLGWGSSSTDTSVDYNAGANYTPNASTTLYAIWKQHALTVNYYSNYATSSFEGALNAVSSTTNVLVCTETLYYSDKQEYGLGDYTRSTSSVYLAKSGYTATGYWNTKPDGSGTSILQTASFETGQALAEAFGLTLETGNASVNVYAQWSKTIKLTYNANGGAGAPSSKSETIYNSTASYTFTISTTEPTKYGHNFLGWSTSSSATTATYLAGGTITISKDTTLYAIWTPHTHTVVYHGNGGTGVPNNQTKVYGDVLTLSSVVPTRPGYTFVGWGLTADDTSVNYYPGSMYGLDQNGGTFDLYAIWKYANVGWKKVDGEYKKYNTYIKVNNKWTPFIVYYKDNSGIWRQGVI